MARNFNGTSDRIIIDAAVTHVTWWNDVMGRAWAGWVKAPAGQSNAFFYSEGSSASNTPFWGLSLISGGTNLLRWSGANQPGVSSVSVIGDNTWHHVALVIYPIATSGNWYGLYVDGVLEASGTMGSTNTGGNVNQAALGALRRTSTTSFYKGLLAHWAVWNRSLSGEEIRMLARGTRLPSDFAPQHYWPMTDGEVGFIEDRGHRRNHGTLVGTTVSVDTAPVRERVTPATWLRRYGAIASSSVTITLSDSGALALQSDAPTVPVTLASATLMLSAGDAIVYPVTVAINPLSLQADDLGLSGPETPNSGVLVLKADAPSQSGPVAPTGSGQLQLRADAPTIWTAIQPNPGKLLLAGDAPTVIPFEPSSGQELLKADPPAVSPGGVGSGLLRLAGDAPTVYPVVMTGQGTLILKSDLGFVSSIGVELSGSGILRLRSDVPVVTPLTEPVTPPPPTAGEGIALAATV